MKFFARKACRASGGGFALGRPCWASSAQLPNKRASEHFAQGPICPPDITGLAEEVCLACMPGCRRGGALGGPGQPSANFTGKPRGLTPHEWGFAKKRKRKNT
eukprot:1144874-Pelagomonas_calceolata.AAC.1